MTTRIARSAIRDPDAFAVEVAAFAHEHRNWTAHMERVKHDEDRGVTGIERHAPYPRPLHHQLVMDAVNEHGQPDYEIFDDGPSASQVLQSKKTGLLAEVSCAEAAAIAALVPAGKRRLLNMRAQKIREDDRDRYAKAAEARSGLLTKLMITSIDPADLAADVEAMRPAADTAFLKEQDEIKRKIDAIEQSAAQAMHDIEDLTIDTIDRWTMPEF
jgi:hypothetical protein